ncbi:hypothetical protein [Paracraurococcus lichenis]|uniref:ATP-grasp domain-containing protein n=1 Tax=Paracraurococcus lichenis TaxID=3064888 RepID=A0ABT9DT46_9PROT|nr:hypothetical protein [Paracraurococcus sp. LOR1-02]MDO9707079.1 hypothetical protein [Paracraurococcus sp. LOR1-02]
MSISNIVIVAGPEDLHALAVQQAVVKMGGACAVVDFREIDKDISLEADLDVSSDRSSQGHASVFLGAFADLEFSAATSVWLRRPMLPIAQYSIRDPRYRSFIRAEWRAALMGLTRLSGCNCVNDPIAEEQATLKPAQLSAAHRVGLRIPKTLVTNSATRCQAFIDLNRRSGRRTIFKPLTPPLDRLGEVRSIETVEAYREELELAPVIFQECIERGMDIRVTYVDGECFSANILSDHEALIDWRSDPNVVYERTTLANAVENGLRRLMCSLGLRVGCIDLRIGRDGTVYFFEVNPSGQFLFMDLELDLPVAAAVARALLRNPASRQSYK